jgi:glutathione S-transferase
MELVFAVILVALIVYIVFTGLVGRARMKYNVPAPAMSGHPGFERANRVHQNTLESLIVFLPAVWIFGVYVNARWAAALGVVFIVARVVYAIGYLRAAEKRGLGAGVTAIVNMVLVIGALVGVVRALL